MKKLVLIGVLVAAATAPSALAERLTIQVTSIALSVKPTDVAPKGASKGDTIEYRDRLVNVKARFGRAKGAVVGSDHGTMTFSDKDTATFSGVAHLPGGTLRLVGKIIALPNHSFVIPVKGGTGRFAKAKGYVVVGPGEKTALNTYRLTVPTIPVA